MTVAVSVDVTGMKGLRELLRRLSPEHQREVLIDSLLECGQLVADNARMKQIRRGGQGKHGTLPPLPHKLTSRHGRLRGSIAMTWHRKPFELDVGSDVEYAGVHEFGFKGTVRVKQHKRRISQAFGRPIKSRNVTVKSHSRDVKIEPRPFMAPAVRATEDKFAGIFLANWRRFARV